MSLDDIVDGLEIANYLDKDPEAIRRFESSKKKTFGPWIFAAVGEWSTMSGSSGKHRFSYRVSKDRSCWALKHEGFPSRIVATAFAPTPLQAEVIIGRMIGQIEEAGGPWIDAFYDVSEDLDLSLLWSSWDDRE